MPEIRVVRTHTLGLAQARTLALQWADQATNQFGMACTHQDDSAAHEVSFWRSGVHGRLSVTGDRFEMDATLGFLFGAFKDRIEKESGLKLDALLCDLPVAGQA